MTSLRQVWYFADVSYRTNDSCTKREVYINVATRLDLYRTYTRSTGNIEHRRCWEGVGKNPRGSN